MNIKSNQEINRERAINYTLLYMGKGNYVQPATKPKHGDSKPTSTRPAVCYAKTLHSY
jgi:hypothetical protein